MSILLDLGPEIVNNFTGKMKVIRKGQAIPDGPQHILSGIPYLWRSISMVAAQFMCCGVQG
ncbi:hypothetical protein N7488_006093 [Penicillium malachiteum]|nr:hypothetical protein N7488_006093 [Penicillium malachiteum]